ncbi:hypothetical protein F6P96_12225 [Escherichia coli]|nr:hypothetical protein F6P96_12225 [Escherichia coli]
MKLTDKPLSFGYSVVDSHSSFCLKSKNPPVYAGGSLNQVKLTDKPLSFGYSVVDSHSSFCLQKQNPPKRVFT